MNSTERYTPFPNNYQLLALPINRQEIHNREIYLNGEIIFDKHSSVDHLYKVSEGEVVILRDGLPVDLVEAGEYLDTQVWAGATAIAWTHCRLKAVDRPMNCLSHTYAPVKL